MLEWWNFNLGAYGVTNDDHKHAGANYQEVS